MSFRFEPRWRHRRLVLALASALPALCVAQTPGATSSTALPSPTEAAAAVDDSTHTRSGGVVTITGTLQPTALPTQIPATVEGLTREQLERTVNARDSEDALKYLPSLLVRKRYIGDYNHAILSSRASGTGNSARSAVYADGILLSNFLGNGVGGLSFPPRWGMVSPEEIERVDVMYGPFSAAFPGNSVGAVVVYTTRMPERFEAHARVGFSRQDFDLYNTHGRFDAWEASASLGDRSGALAWRLSLQHADSQGQPLTFATRLVSSGTAGTAGTVVSGAVLDANNANQPWYVVGTGTQYHTRQDQLKGRLSFDLSPTLRASYLLGVWTNGSDNRPQSYLRNAAGDPVTSGVINIDGRSYAALTGADFAANREDLTHVMHGLSLKSRTLGTWDGELTASQYDYRRDDKRQNGAANTLPGALSGGAGTIAAGGGTGWMNLAVKGTWRPQGLQGAHIVEAGVQQDRYTLRYRTSSIAGNWLVDPAGARVSDVSGQTQLRSVYAQDSWRFAPDWTSVFGLRAEQWQAWGGQTRFSATSAIEHPSRSQGFVSPKGALSFQARPDLVLKASLGRAVRMPTIAELYGATSTTNSQYINDPNLRPERSWTGELTAEKDIPGGLLRLTAFGEDTRDALYAQTTFDAAANRNISRVQNVGRIGTKGLELVVASADAWIRGLELNGSLTWTDSTIKANDGFVVTPGDTLGKRQPNIPAWRATALASYRFAPQWTGAFGLRYSGRQYRTLNNADVNGYSYQGVSPYLTADLRLRWQIDRQWSAAFGIDNLNNDKFWNFHPYPQRSFNAELKVDL